MKNTDAAMQQFSELITEMSTISRAIWNKRFRELIEVGPIEQSRRDAMRRQESLEDIHRRSKSIHELREEACLRAGGNVADIDHEPLDRADGRG